MLVDKVRGVPETCKTCWQATVVLFGQYQVDDISDVGDGDVAITIQVSIIFTEWGHLNAKNVVNHVGDIINRYLPVKVDIAL